MFKRIRLRAVYPDGVWITGELYHHWWYRVTPGTHHLKVTASSISSLVGKKVAVVVDQVRYFVLEDL
jgi:hypothetical protein